jgi:magnesium transporter
VDQESAAWTAVRHGETSLAVADVDGRFLGLIPPHRLLGVLLAEHAEDMARLGGYLHDTGSARAASEESVRRRFLHRLPWLLLGLAGAYLAAGIVGAYEEAIRANLLVAYFMPGIVYIADAVGTQTETIVIRGLAVGVRVGGVILREALTGVLVGLVLAALFFPLALAGWGDERVATTVSLAILASCSVATLVATGLPWLLSRLRVDPAFGSGPLATVIQDLLSILIYLSIALAVAE